MSDQQRDAAIDLAVCAAATPGPWRGDETGVTVNVGVIGRPEADGPYYKILFVVHPPLGDEAYKANSEFAATAREALPWWIQEAINEKEKRLAAEKEVARLMSIITATRDFLSHTLLESTPQELVSKTE